MFSVHNRIELEINNKDIFQQSQNSRKLNNILQNNPQVKEIMKNLENNLNCMKTKTQQNL